MPKELTHWLVAERALAGLPAESVIAGTIRDHHNLYLAGAVLPDTLLHLFRGPHAAAALALANRFHDSRGNSFGPLIDAEQRHGGVLAPPLLACLLGVIAHMQADMIFHPFVYALAPPEEMGEHYRIETAIDVHFLGRGTMPPVRLLSELVDREVRPQLVDAMAAIFDPEGTLPRSALEHALQLHCRFQRMYDRTFWKLAVRVAALVAGDPYRDQRHLFYPLTCSRTGGFGDDAVEWRHPVSGEAHRSTLKQLADEAVFRSVSTFESIEDAGSLSAALAGRAGENLLTGMHGACQERMKYRGI